MKVSIHYFIQVIRLILAVFQTNLIVIELNIRNRTELENLLTTLDFCLVLTQP